MREGSFCAPGSSPTRCIRNFFTFPQAQARIAAQGQEMIVNKLQHICYKRCVNSSVERISDKQRKCLTACAMAFVEGVEVAVSPFSLSSSFPDVQPSPKYQFVLFCRSFSFAVGCRH